MTGVAPARARWHGGGHILLRLLALSSLRDVPGELVPGATLLGSLRAASRKSRSIA